jgi:hypothetical protein
LIPIKAEVYGVCETETGDLGVWWSARNPDHQRWHVIVVARNVPGGPAMPTIRHVENYFTGCETVRDVVIGMADGLTIPFALAAASLEQAVLT